MKELISEIAGAVVYIVLATALTGMFALLIAAVSSY
jgi:hypothetical protein